MPRETISNIVGFDDAPFNHCARKNVLIVGAVYSGSRLEGVLSAYVRRDGVNSTRNLIKTIQKSRFYPQLQAVLLQGIAFAGFNVIDIHTLYEQLGLPVIVVSRKKPDLAKIRKALLENVPGGERKWQLIESAGAMEKIHNVFVQRAGISKEKTEKLLAKLAISSSIPEPLRTAHLIAGGVVMGESKHRV